MVGTLNQTPLTIQNRNPFGIQAMTVVLKHALFVFQVQMLPQSHRIHPIWSRRKFRGTRKLIKTGQLILTGVPSVSMSRLLLTVIQDMNFLPPEAWLTERWQVKGDNHFIVMTLNKQLHINYFYKSILMCKYSYTYACILLYRKYA